MFGKALTDQKQNRTVKTGPVPRGLSEEVHAGRKGCEGQAHRDEGALTDGEIYKSLAV